MQSARPPQDPKTAYIRQRRAVSLINGNFDLPQATLNYMREIRKALSEAAHKIQVASRHYVKKGGKLNDGRHISGLDALQAAKDTFCVAAIMDYGDEASYKAGLAEFGLEDPDEEEKKEEGEKMQE
jgi:hypothetical protein